MVPIAGTCGMTNVFVPPTVPASLHFGWAALVHLVSAALCAAKLGRPAAALDVHFPLLQAARPGGSDVGMKGIVSHKLTL